MYGNVGDSDGTWSESSIFVEPEFSLVQKTGVPEAIKSTTYEPYPMYYYGLAGEGTNQSRDIPIKILRKARQQSRQETQLAVAMQQSRFPVSIMA